jgi:hypothetical protein
MNNPYKFIDTANEHEAIDVQRYNIIVSGFLRLLLKSQATHHEAFGMPFSILKCYEALLNGEHFVDVGDMAPEQLRLVIRFHGKKVNQLLTNPRLSSQKLFELLPTPDALLSTVLEMEFHTATEFWHQKEVLNKSEKKQKAPEYYPPTRLI